MKNSLDCLALERALEFLNVASTGSYEETRKMYYHAEAVMSSEEFGLLAKLSNNTVSLTPCVQSPDCVAIKISMQVSPKDKNTVHATIAVGTKGQIISSSLINLDRTKDVEVISQTNGVTPLKLMSNAVRFIIADALCDLSVHGPLLAEDAEGYGVTGKEAILKSKEEWLREQKLVGKSAYRLLEPFILDFNQRKVSFRYDCLMESKRGRGEEDITMNEEGLITKVHSQRI